MTNKTCIFIFFLLLAMSFACFPDALYAKDTSEAFKSTPYPVPRFVSLSSDEVYVRTGPGSKYPIKFVYKKKGLPVEVILEYEAWRKIRDHEGDQGWVHQSLTSGRRVGIIQGEALVPFYAAPKTGARLVAKAEPGAMGAIDRCESVYCRIEISGYKGWVERAAIWGVYENEVID